MALEARMENLENEVKHMSTVMSVLIDSINGLTAVMSAGKDIAPGEIKAQAAQLKEVDAAEQETVEEAEPEKVITVEVLQSALINLAKTKGKDAAKALLTEYGANKLGDIKEEDYADVHDKAIQRAEAA